MKRAFVFLTLLLAAAHATADTSYSDAGFYAGEAGLNPSERAGREIWYKATAGNDRFHTYTFQQRVGVLIDWFRVLNSDSREDRYAAWGLINDPSCCKPGDEGCPAKSMEETYGFDWCPGDEELLKYVGKTGYRDPACDFKDSPISDDDPHGPKDQRQSSCDLKFGTSTGAMGLRKFPNPRFNEKAWRELNGDMLGTWIGYDARLSDNRQHPDSKVSRLSDGSIEPPFMIGMACGTCHIAFNPENPPADPVHPKWENLLGAIGNQYGRLSEVMASGMSTDTLEWQMFSHARPGTTDTSAVPNDQVNNPGTMNSIINLSRRPVFANEDVVAWRKATACDANESYRECWCEPGRENKCWRRSLQKETVHHILKGGGDSIGALGAVQRVYFNIGSCSEQCWVNHLTDLRVLDPNQRGFGQTPFDIGQCRRDCASFRAIEDRLQNVVDFFMSFKTDQNDLVEARAAVKKANDPNATYTFDDLREDLEKEFGDGAVERGSVVFAENCASCHSSQEGAEKGDFYKTNERGIRTDFLGNDKSTLATEVGTYRCRALHSNHMKGHVWEEFASETYRAKPDDPKIVEPSDGGRGYYRNIPLLNLWAHAPFLHNNALGPELCGNPKNRANDFYASPYVKKASDRAYDWTLSQKAPGCSQYDPSVEGRYSLYKASMHDLLNPSERDPKVTLLEEDIHIDIGPRLWDGDSVKKVVGFEIVIPEGTPVGLLGNFQHKQFIDDLILLKVDSKKLKAKLTNALGEDQAKVVMASLESILKEVVSDPSQLVNAVKSQREVLLTAYSSCTDEVENKGHEFGQGLSKEDKDALTAFLATM